MSTNYADSITSAERVLSAELGGPVSLHLDAAVADYPGVAALVLRCRVENSANVFPDTVIVKRSMSGDSQIFREWSSLEFLNSVDQVRHLVPRLYGGDEDQGILVMEDLGRNRELLGNIVEGHDAERAEQGLFAFQRALGELHAGTIGQQDTFRTIPVRGDASATSRHVINRVDATLSMLPEQFRNQGLDVDQHMLDEVERMRQTLADPGPFLGFTHGDAAIGNVFVEDDAPARLIDFESSDFRHVLLDGSYARMRYLISVWARRMPVDLQRRLLDAYRAALVDGCPEASDDDQFARGLLACSAFWLAAILVSLPSVVDEDRKRGRSTERQRIVAALDHFVQLSEDAGRTGPIAIAADELRRRLRERWPESDCRMRLCNAFQQAE